MSEREPLREQPVREVLRRGDDVVVRLAGELDLYNAPVLREALRAAVEQPPRRIVVDLADVAFVDSTALGVLLETRGLLADREGFVLAAAGAETRRTLQVSRLDRHIRVADTVDDALAG